jgi:hypothetical protein
MNREEHKRRIQQSIELTKKAIEAEQRGATCKKDQEYLQKQIREAQAAPAKYQKQAQERLEQTKQYLENKKQERLNAFKRDLEMLESVQDDLPSKPKRKWWF